DAGRWGEHARVPAPRSARGRRAPSGAPAAPRPRPPARRLPSGRVRSPALPRRCERSSRPIPRRHFLFFFLRDRGWGFPAAPLDTVEPAAARDALGLPSAPLGDALALDLSFVGAPAVRPPPA